MTKEDYNRRAIGKTVWVVPDSNTELFRDGGTGTIMEVLDEETFLIGVPDLKFGTRTEPVDIHNVRY
jgi:hypothetical protein